MPRTDSAVLALARRAARRTPIVEAFLDGLLDAVGVLADVVTEWMFGGAA